MVEILRVDRPQTGQENIARIKPDHVNQKVPYNINQTDPGKVGKTEEQNVHPDRKQNQAAYNLGSNFEKFMQAVKNTPSLAEMYGEMFFSKLGSQVNAGLSEGFVQELGQYMNMLKVSDAELLEFLKGQQVGAAKFSGPFFDLLRQMVKTGGQNSELSSAVLDFLRRYDSLTSGPHILKNMIANLKNIAASMPKSVGVKLNDMIGTLYIEHPPGKNAPNLAVLKNEILPFLANYVSSSKDFGMARDIMAVLTLNIARYESGTEEGFLQSFRTLMGFSEMNRSLPGVDIKALAQRLMTAQANAGEAGALSDKLVSILAKGMSGAAGVESKAVFENMLSSLLLNESVYMPLVHITVPADINGRQFFSEIWVDPDDKSGNKGKGDGGEGRAIKLLVKFDIRDLGYFEMILFSQNGKVDLELFYPEVMEDKEKLIVQGISEIMARNSLTFRTLSMGKCITPKSISEVFPKLYERRNAINVTI